MEAAFKSDVGQLRHHNEDDGGVFFNQDGIVLAIVADGMGGHQAGDVASKMTIQMLSENWQTTNGLTVPTAMEAWLEEAINHVNTSIYTHAKHHPNCQGMGTTVVTVICTDQFVTFAHIGDSRAYLWNGEQFVQKTVDHSLVNELVRSGQITQEEAEHHPRRNVLLRAVGTEQEIKVDIGTIEWDAGNFVLLCSDGLSNKITDQEMQAILEEEGLLQEKVQKMIDMANQRGGEDNISVAIVCNQNVDNNGDENDR